MDKDNGLKELTKEIFKLIIVLLKLFGTCAFLFFAIKGIASII